MKKRLIYLDKWINHNTYASDVVVELGAGFFDRLANVNESVKTKIGIEIYKPYIDNAKYDECIKIEGNLLRYKEYLTNYKLDTVMIIDVLEHFETNVALDLIENLKKDFNKILLMLPLGKYEQHQDVTGFGGHEYQTHKSYWYVNDVKKLEFHDNIIDSTFHSTEYRIKNNLDTACYFGVWFKK